MSSSPNAGMPHKRPRDEHGSSAAQAGSKQKDQQKEKQKEKKEKGKARPRAGLEEGDEGPLYFNSKTAGKHALLSNFHGPRKAHVEAAYQYAVAVRGDSVKKLFKHWLKCSKEEFVAVLQRLQPDKKNWTEAKLKYWLRDGEPIRGILFKLVAGAVKAGEVVDRRRWAVLQSMAPDIQPRSPKTQAERAAIMKQCLRAKYADPVYRDLLLSTGDRPLHERPMRGKGEGNAWTHYVDADGKVYGGDLLGRLLGEVRAEIRAAL